VYLSTKSLTRDNTQTFKISWIYIHISETVNNINPLIFFHRIISIVTMSLKNHNYSSIILLIIFQLFLLSLLYKTIYLTKIYLTPSQTSTGTI